MNRRGFVGLAVGSVIPTTLILPDKGLIVPGQAWELSGNAPVIPSFMIERAKKAIRNDTHCLVRIISGADADHDVIQRIGLRMAERAAVLYAHLGDANCPRSFADDLLALGRIDGYAHTQGVEGVGG